MHAISSLALSVCLFLELTLTLCCSMLYGRMNQCMNNMISSLCAILWFARRLVGNKYIRLGFLPTKPITLHIAGNLLSIISSSDTHTHIYRHIYIYI